MCFPEDFPSFNPSIDEPFPSHFDFSPDSSHHDNINPSFSHELSKESLFSLDNYYMDKDYKDYGYEQVSLEKPLSKISVFNNLYGPVESTYELANKLVSFDETTEGCGDFVRTFEANMSREHYESRTSSVASCDNERLFDGQVCLLTKKFDVETHSNASSDSSEQARQSGWKKELRPYTPVKCNAKPWPRSPLSKSPH